MKYRVTYKRFSDVSNGFVLVNEDIDADNFSVSMTGSLVFRDGLLNARAIPPGAWTLVEPAPITKPTSTNIGEFGTVTER